MGIGGISVWQLLIVLAIVIMLFGTKRLRTLGSDLGSAIKGFKKSMQDDGDKAPADDEDAEHEVPGAATLQRDESTPFKPDQAREEPREGNPEDNVTAAGDSGERKH